MAYYVSKDMKPTVIIAIVVVVIVLAGAGWYVYSNPALAVKLGLRHAPAQTPSSPNSQFGDRGGFATGTIEVLNDNGFTLTLSNGDTKTIDISATTTLQNYATASSTPTTITSDQLMVGEQVFVIGEPQADGSIDAHEVNTGAMPQRSSGGTGPGHFRGPNGGVPQPN
jgi:hypothetical protein